VHLRQYIAQWDPSSKRDDFALRRYLETHSRLCWATIDEAISRISNFIRFPFTGLPGQLTPLRRSKHREARLETTRPWMKGLIEPLVGLSYNMWGKWFRHRATYWEPYLLLAAGLPL
jgi:hypothetical protein